VGATRPQAVPLHRVRRGYASARFALLILLALGLAVWAAGRVLPELAKTPTAGGVYREAVVAAWIELDPLVAVGSPKDPDPTPLLFRGLVQVDEHGEIRPDLAERWTVLGEGRVFRFFLRPGLRWDDGQPLTTADVAHTVQQAVLTNTGDQQPSFWAAVDLRLLAPDVVEFALREPLGAFLEHAALPVMPAHAPFVRRLPAASSAERPISNGPYRVVVDEAGLVALERNPLYFGTSPKLDRVEFHLVPTQEAALQALLSGQVDGLAGLSNAERSHLSGVERLAVYDITEFNKYSVLVFNTQSRIFEQQIVRQAVARGLDREAVIQAAFDGAGEPAVGPLSPLSWAFDIDLRSHPYEPWLARELLDSVGWQVVEPSSPRQRGSERLAISLLANDAPTRLPEAAEVARQLEAIGFEVRVQPMPLPDLVQRLRTGNFEAAVIGRWLAQTDPDQFSLWHSTQARGIGTNDSGISSPEMDRWLEVGRRQLGLDERTEAYRRFQSVWMDEQPSVLLYHPRTAYALSRELHGAPMGPLPDASWRLRRLPEWYRRSP
jgi:peptide/nickel transport system substrate-binding protein